VIDVVAALDAGVTAGALAALEAEQGRDVVQRVRAAGGLLSGAAVGLVGAPLFRVLSLVGGGGRAALVGVGFPPFRRSSAVFLGVALAVCRVALPVLLRVFLPPRLFRRVLPVGIFFGPAGVVFLALLGMGGAVGGIGGLDLLGITLAPGGGGGVALLRVLPVLCGPARRVAARRSRRSGLPTRPFCTPCRLACSRAGRPCGTRRRAFLARTWSRFSWANRSNGPWGQRRKISGLPPQPARQNGP